MSELELIDQILRHSLELQRLSAHEEAQALAILRELEGELRALLASKQLSDVGQREVEALLKEAEKAIKSSYTRIPGQIDTQELAILVADRTVAAMQLAIPAAKLPTAERLSSLTKDVMINGAPSSAWWERQADDLAFKFSAEVRQGVIAGETQERIVGRIVGSPDELGIMDLARRNVRSLVHTSIMSAANQARLATFKKNKRHLKGVRWLATLDGHTCIQCMALDGQSWDLKGKALSGTTLDFQLPPAHFACRCVATPIAKGLDEIFGTAGLDARMGAQTRASKDGPTTAVSFDDFLKRQSPEFVDEMLGVKRADMWRRGKLTLRDLVSGTGRPLTLDELKTR